MEVHFCMIERGGGRVVEFHRCTVDFGGLLEDDVAAKLWK